MMACNILVKPETLASPANRQTRNVPYLRTHLSKRPHLPRLKFDTISSKIDEDLWDKDDDDDDDDDDVRQ